jgi:ActD protein
MASYVLAEFREEAALFAAARRLRELGHRRLDTYSPVPLHGAEEALGLRKSIVPLIALVAGVTGAVGGYVMQWWMNGVDYAINVANRPPHSPPANIPITFESGVLVASVSIVVGLIVLSGLPRLHHPVFEVEGFRTASVDGLWLSVEVKRDDEVPVARELDRLGALQVSRVPEETR